MRLRSGTLREAGSVVDLGQKEAKSKRVNLPDLNLSDGGDGVASEDGGGGECCDVSVENLVHTVSKSIGSGSEGGGGGSECKGVEDEEKGTGKSSLGNGDGILKACSSKFDRGSGISEMDLDVSGDGNSDGNGDGKDSGLEKVNGDLCLVNEISFFSEEVKEGLDSGKSMVIDHQKVEEENLEVNVAVSVKATCPQGVATSGTDHIIDKPGDLMNISFTKSGNGKHDNYGKMVSEECDVDLELSLKSNSGSVKDSRVERAVLENSSDEGDQSDRLRSNSKEGEFHALGRVLRSRIVPANGVGQEGGSGKNRATPNKRKSEPDSSGDIAVEMGDEASKVPDDSKRLCSSGRPKRSNELSHEEVLELNNLIRESNARDANDMSLKSSEKKRKRGRPRKTTVQSNNSGVHVDQVQAVSEMEDRDMGDRSTPKTRKDRSREHKTIDSRQDDETAGKGEDEAGEVSKKSAGSATERRKSERSKKMVDYCEKEVVRRKKYPGRKLDYESADEDKGLTSIGDASLKKPGKRGRPRKQEGSGPVKMASNDIDTSDDRNKKASSTPIRQHRQDIKRHGVPQTSTDRVPSVKRTPSHKKVISGGTELQAVDSFSKGAGTSSTENNSTAKRKRVEHPGSLTAEKNSIRNQIVDMLLQAGWTVEHRPRNGRHYNDAVYVNREGKTHWSVTKAYFSLKQEFEEGKASSAAATSNFTPLPEELLGRLFRVVSKTRSDKNKKKEHFGWKRKKSVVHDGTQNRRRCALVARRSKGLNSESDEVKSYLGKHSILAWLIDSGVVSLNGKVLYKNRRKTRTMSEGSITRDGICCHCCKKVYSVFEFEKHSGGRPGQPYENLYLENGQSLIQCQLDSWNKQDASSLKGFHSVKVDADDPNDDTCALCGDGGDLMCCDGCPSTFHNDCLNIEEVPSGEWHCVYCSCKFCGEAETEMIDDCDAASSSLVICCLCEEKFHPSCADEEERVRAIYGSATFCGKICEQIFERLQTLIGAKSDLGDGFSWTLLQRFDVNGGADCIEAQKVENNSKLAVALSIMDECFVPIMDPRSGINLIRHVVYNSGSNIMRLNFRSFFTIILEKGDEVISAASIRIHGKQLAEMPFIGTRNIYRRQGMCRRLLTAIELALGSLDIENLVIPAIPELMDTWTSVFGFQTLEESIREEMKSMNMLVFAHTDMLQKPLLKKDLLDKGITTIENSANCTKSNAQLNGGLEKSEVDDDCFNGSFDLNVVAPCIPESSSDERPADSYTENRGTDVKNGTDVGGLDDAHIAEGQPTPMDISGKRVVHPTVDLNTSEGCVTSDHPEPSCDEKGSVYPCSIAASSDAAAKTSIDSCGQTKDTGSTLECDPDQLGTVSAEKGSMDVTLNPDLNLIGSNMSGYSDSLHSSLVDHEKVGGDLSQSNGFAANTSEGMLGIDLNLIGQNIIGYGNSLHPTLADQEKGIDGLSVLNGSAVNTSDDQELGTVPCGASGGNSSPERKLCSKSEIPGTSILFPGSATGVSLNVSLQTVADSAEHKESDSPVACTSLTQVSSESPCNKCSVADESGTTGLINGSGVPKVGSE